jgi:hypothetical protein
VGKLAKLHPAPCTPHAVRRMPFDANERRVLTRISLAAAR